MTFSELRHQVKDHEPLTLSTPLAVCCKIALESSAVAFASFPSGHIDTQRMCQQSVERTPLTFNDLCDFVLDVVRDLQNLRSCHASLFLCQFIKSLECILKFGPPDQLL